MLSYLPAQVGDRFKVGQTCRQTGHYVHEGCHNTEVYLKGNEFVPCHHRACPNPGAGWELWEILTFDDLDMYL